MVTPPGQPPVEDVRGRLTWALGQVPHTILGDVLGRGGIAALLDDREPTFTTLVRDLLTPYTTALAGLIEDDAAAGRLRKDLDADAVVSLMLGFYLSELLATAPSTPTGSPAASTSSGTP